MILSASLVHRHQRLKAKLKADKINCLLISNSYNLTYLTGVPYISHLEREAFIIFTVKHSTLIVSPLIISKFSHLKKLFTILPFSQSNTISSIINKKKAASVHFEPEDFKVAELSRLKKKTTTSFKPSSQIIEQLRQIKDDYELSQIKRACRLTAKAWKLIKPQIKPGQTEIEIADQLISLLKQLGADGLPAGFDPIIASGPNSAIPHHSSSRRQIKPNQPLLVDFGCTINGYCSDMTRTTFVGQPSNQFSRFETIVKTAHRRALSKLNQSNTADKIDLAARNHITTAGFGDNFIHTTGHGLGLDIHEQPSIGPSSKTKLKPNTTITIEPGIYLSGKFGYRHEDTVQITDNGYQILTK